jgi:hypothetical protein
MSTQPISVKTDIDLPAGNGEVFIVLVEKGAVQVSYGISLFRGSTNVREVVPYGVNPVNVPHSLGRAEDLRGLSTTCRGVAFHPGARSVTFRCDFLVDDDVFAKSDDAVIDLTSATPSRQFYIRCRFK